MEWTAVPGEEPGGPSPRPAFSDGVQFQEKILDRSRGRFLMS